MPSSAALRTGRRMLNSKMAMNILPWVIVVCVCFVLPSNEAGAADRPWRRHGQHYYKHPHETIAAKTIKTADGDIFDCVGIHEQPTLAMLKDHKVQMRPSSYPRDNSEDKDFREEVISQFELEDGGCPQGTIPIHRIQNNNTLAKTISPTAANVSSSLSNAAGYKNHWAEIQTIQGTWHGGAAGINVYGVRGVGPRQLSSSLIWIINRQAGAAIEAGWTVHPQLFGDTNTRLFISWSADGERTHCYNLQCPGFVQVSPSSPLGGILRPLSVYKGQQYIIRVYVFRDWRTGNWWFSFGSPSNFIGYWPSKTFRGFDHASEVHYGGYVGCYAADVRCPPMGNGHFPSQKPNDSACFFREVQYFDRDLRLRDVTPEMQHRYANRPECYDVGAYRYVGGTASHVFTFGGPGCYY